jgi:hypothetical protein
LTKKRNALKIEFADNHLRRPFHGSISITELLTTIFVLVDDWYQAYGCKLLNGKVGKKPVFKKVGICRAVT